MRLISFILLCLSGVVHAGPAIQTWETSNGAKVYFVAAPELPMVDIRVVFDAGSARENEKWGLSALTNGVMTEGADGLSAEQISEYFEDVGAQLGRGSLRDMAYVSVRSITNPANFDPALEGLAKVITKPDFPKAAFERQQKRTLIGIEQKKQSPSALAGDAFYHAVYGDHPYAHPSSGTEETISSFTREDLISFYNEWYTARNSVIAIVGDLKLEQAKAAAEKVVGGLSVGKKAPCLEPVSDLTEAKTVRIHHPSSQTTIYVGQPGMKRGDPDYFPLYVGNHSLGGSGLVSRLSDEVREKRGLSYSVYSYFSPMGQKGPFMSGMQTRNDQVDEGLTVLKETIKNYVVDGQTEDEFSASVKNITGGFPLRIDNNGKIVEYLSMIGFYDLPLDYLDTFINNIESLNVDQTRDAMKRNIDPEKMVTVIVGGSVEKPAEESATGS
ncbi:MAG: M16 family metallopeptidase [Gammaproteobacteria bacterium]